MVVYDKARIESLRITALNPYIRYNVIRRFIGNGYLLHLEQCYADAYFYAFSQDSHMSINYD